MPAKPPPDRFGSLRGALDRFGALGRSRRTAAIASVAWSVLVGAYAIGFFGASRARGTVFLDGAFFLVTLALPLILIWLAAFLAEELARQRELIGALAELVGPLAGALDDTRAALERHAPASPADIQKAVQNAVLATRGVEPAAAPLQRLAAGQAAILARLDGLREPSPQPSATPSPAEPVTAVPTRGRRRTDAPAPPSDGQLDLPMLAKSEPEDALGWDDLIRALDFPRDADDADGFSALRRALRQRSLAQTLQAAEDVMTLLSQEGVYMDDLQVEPPDPQALRRFAAGARAEAAAGMGGVRDDAAVEAARALMQADAIFRDTALVFQRRFDGLLSELAEDAGDAELARLADTRSGRAFQLMVAASGAIG